MEVEMKKQFIVTMMLVVLAYCLVPLYAESPFEGYWDQTTVTDVPVPGLKGEQTIKQRIFFKNGMMKMLDLETEEYTIFRLDKELVWTVKPSEKTYQEMKFSDLEGQMDEAKKQMARMREEMKNMPPEQRKMMEKMMGSSMLGMDDEEPLEMKIVATDETKTINGHKCRRFNMMMGNEVVSIMWLTNKYNLGNDYMNMYKRMNKLGGKLSGDMDKIDGFAIQSISTVDVGGGKKIHSETSVVKIVPQSIPDSEFALPRGLKKIEMKMDWN